MIFRILKMYIVVNPYILISLGIILIKRNILKGLLCFLALTIHELGHIIVAYNQGERISILKILPFGFSCQLKNQSKITSNKMLKILIAGPAVNIITAGLVFYWTPQFAMINLLIGLFNLIPIGELDGMRILNILMYH